MTLLSAGDLSTRTAHAVTNLLAVVSFSRCVFGFDSSDLTLTFLRPDRGSLVAVKKVSICIPTYNGAEFIGDALESAIRQSYEDLEILVVDDGSTDRTIEIANSIAKHDRRVLVRRNQIGLGIPRNWDRCRDLASGDAVMFLFQDDLYRHDCVEKMVGNANQNSCSIVCCRRSLNFSPDVSAAERQYFLDYFDQYNIDRMLPKSRFLSPAQFCDAVTEFPTANFVGEPTAVLLKKHVLQKFGRFDSALRQLVDFEYWTRIAIHSGIGYVPEPLVSFRVHSKSATAHNAQQSVRLDWLDGIVLLHKYLHAPVFGPLRCSSKKNYIRLLKHYARRAGQLKRGDNRIEGDPPWCVAVQHYPDLARVSSLVQAAETAERIWTMLRRHRHPFGGGKAGREEETV